MSRIIFWSSLMAAFAFLVLPIAVVLPLAFNDSSFLSYPVEGFTLRWFEAILVQPPWQGAMTNSLIVALGSMALAVVVGGLAAMGAILAGRYGEMILTALFVSPLVIPTVVLGVAMTYAFARVGLSGSYGGLIVAHAVLGTPLVFLSVMTSLKRFDQDLDRAAASLGASRFYRFRTVTLPVTLPGFVIGAIFAFITSFDEVVVALFLSSPRTTTLPITLFAGLRDKLEPTIVALAVLLLFISVAFFVVLRLVQVRADNHPRRP